MARFVAKRVRTCALGDGPNAVHPSEFNDPGWAELAAGLGAGLPRHPDRQSRSIAGFKFKSNRRQVNGAADGFRPPARPDILDYGLNFNWIFGYQSSIFNWQA